MRARTPQGSTPATTKATAATGRTRPWLRGPAAAPFPSGPHVRLRRLGVTAARSRGPGAAAPVLEQVGESLFDWNLRHPARVLRQAGVASQDHGVVARPQP